MVMNLQLLFQEPLVFFVFVAAFLLILSVHEFSHALAAYMLGDRTAEREGRLTLNPMAHVDPIGFITLLAIGFGWGKPVPFNPYNLRFPKWGPVMVACAGPLSNFIFGVVSALLLRALVPVLGFANLLVVFLQVSAYLNFILMLFNLIPVPPLDGSKILLALLADEKYRQARWWLETRGSMLLLFVIVLDALFQLGVFRGLGLMAHRLVFLFTGYGALI